MDEFKLWGINAIKLFCATLIFEMLLLPDVLETYLGRTGLWAPMKSGPGERKLWWSFVFCSYNWLDRWGLECCYFYIKSTRLFEPFTISFMVFRTLSSQLRAYGSITKNFFGLRLSGNNAEDTFPLSRWYHGVGIRAPRRVKNPITATRTMKEASSIECH